MPLFREYVGVKPPHVQNFLDNHPAVDEKVERIRERRLIRGRQFFGYELGTGDLARAWIIAKNRHRGE